MLTFRDRHWIKSYSSQHNLYCLQLYIYTEHRKLITQVWILTTFNLWNIRSNCYCHYICNYWLLNNISHIIAKHTSKKQLQCKTWNIYNSTFGFHADTVFSVWYHLSPLFRIIPFPKDGKWTCELMMLSVCPPLPMYKPPDPLSQNLTQMLWHFNVVFFH